MGLPLRARLELALKRSRRRSQGAPYPKVVRELAVAYARQERNAGRSWTEVATSSGLPASTLQKWVEDGEEPTVEGTRALVPVEIREEKACAVTRELVLVSPRGFRLEGLGLGDALEALARLG